ncbi:hypothetical protein Tco_0272945 [Tanacetum coccineum]
MEKTRFKPKEVLTYGMLLTRLFKHVMSVSPGLAFIHYLSHDRAMNPLALHYERKTRADRGKKRPREPNASSSSSTLNHPSSSHPLNDSTHENDDESSHSNPSSPPQNISSSSNNLSTDLISLYHELFDHGLANSSPQKQGSNSASNFLINLINSNAIVLSSSEKSPLPQNAKGRLTLGVCWGVVWHFGGSGWYSDLLSVVVLSWTLGICSGSVCGGWVWVLRVRLCSVVGLGSGFETLSGLLSGAGVCGESVFLWAGCGGSGWGVWGVWRTGDWVSHLVWQVSLVLRLTKS